MLILVLLGVYFDAVVVFVTSQTLLFRLALAILWQLIRLICQRPFKVRKCLFPFNYPRHSMARANLNKSVWLVINTTTASK